MLKKVKITEEIIRTNGKKLSVNSFGVECYSYNDKNYFIVPKGFDIIVSEKEEPVKKKKK